MKIIRLTYIPDNENFAAIYENPIFNNQTGKYEISNPHLWSDTIGTRNILNFFFCTLYANDFFLQISYKYEIELATDFGLVTYFIKQYERDERWFLTEEFFCESSRLAWSHQAEYGYRSRIDNERVYSNKPRNQSMFVELSRKLLLNYPLALDVTMCFFAEEIEKWRTYCDGLSKEERAHSLILERMSNILPSPRREYDIPKNR